jgi:hypothetical protein
MDIHRSGGQLLDNTRLTSHICGGSLVVCWIDRFVNSDRATDVQACSRLPVKNPGAGTLGAFAMTSVDRALSDQNTNDPATTEAIAKELETDVELVREIYRQELTALASDAKITQYLGVLVSKRVRMILRQH